MTPAARFGAAIEILDQIQTGEAAEKALTNWARRSRFAGSKDRAAIRDHVFDVLRCRRSCAVLGGGNTGRALILGLLRLQKIPVEDVFSGIGHAPAPLGEAEQVPNDLPEAGAALDLPDWLIPEVTRSLGEATAEFGRTLQARAPVMLRVNLRKGTREQVLARLSEEGIDCLAVALSPSALLVQEGARRINASEAYQAGLVELQDGASQAVVDQLPLEDGWKVLDYCAGGGGKSLAMAARAKGAFFAHDAHVQRMRDLPERARRAAVSITPLDTPAKLAPYDLVLCDAPCSGSGSWRRSPEGKWALTPEALADINTLQSTILEQAAPLVAPGGWLAYATCSVLNCENEDRVSQFLADRPDWQQSRSQRWLPGPEGDGFFLSLLTRKPDGHP